MNVCQLDAAKFQFDLYVCNRRYFCFTRAFRWIFILTFLLHMIVFRYPHVCVMLPFWVVCLWKSAINAESISNDPNYYSVTFRNKSWIVSSMHKLLIVETVVYVGTSAACFSSPTWHYWWGLHWCWEWNYIMFE